MHRVLTSQEIGAARFAVGAGLLLGTLAALGCGGSAEDPMGGTGGTSSGTGGTGAGGTPSGTGGAGTGGSNVLPNYVISCWSDENIVPDAEGQALAPEWCTDYYGDGPPAYPGCGPTKCSRLWAKATCTNVASTGDVAIRYVNANPDPSTCPGEWAELE